MLKATRQKLEALYAGGEHRGTDGGLHSIDTKTRIGQQQGEVIAELHRKLRPTLSVEIGLAYGFSTLYILDAMKEGGYGGRHIAIDPYAKSDWHGIGLAAIEDAGLSEQFEWISESSCLALAMLAKAGREAQFIYIDGCHLFDYALVDLFLSDKILSPGGLVLLDDLWMPAIRSVMSFIETNMRWYKRIETGSQNLAGYTKVGHDQRPWNYHADFDHRQIA